MKVFLSIDADVLTVFFKIGFLGFGFTVVAFGFGLGFCFGVCFVSDGLFSNFLFFTWVIELCFFFSPLFTFCCSLLVSKV